VPVKVALPWQDGVCCGGARVNLADAQRAYRDILAGLAQAAADRQLPESDLLEARRRLDVVRKQAMRSIDQHTTRRFVSVNTLILSGSEASRQVVLPNRCSSEYLTEP
jgi:hypothetical protein